MTTKEALMQVIREQGFDFFAAADMAEQAIKRGPGTYRVGDIQFTLEVITVEGSET